MSLFILLSTFVNIVKDIETCLLQYVHKIFHLMKWWHNGKDLIPPSGGEEFKSLQLQSRPLPWRFN